MKYNEEQILKEVIKYIKSTYNQHYSTDGKGLQAMDIFRHLDTDKDFCHSNAIKYLIRYGKKQGKNEKDLIKAIHYIVLLISSERDTKKQHTHYPINMHGEEIRDWKTTVGVTYNPDYKRHERIFKENISKKLTK